MNNQDIIDNFDWMVNTLNDETAPTLLKLKLMGIMHEIAVKIDGVRSEHDNMGKITFLFEK